MKILIVDDLHPSFERLMRESRLDYDYRPEIDRTGILDIISNYEGLIIRSKTLVDEELITRSEQLKFVARAGAGTDNIDDELLRRRNIDIINAPEGNRDAVGDHTVGLILSLTKKIGKSQAEVRRGVWDREGNRGIELNSQTVGIIGFGNAGQEVARRLRGFGPRILIYDKYRETEGDYFEQVSLEDLFRDAQIVTFHVPLTTETRYMVDDEFLQKFQHPLLLINTARGEIIDTKALVKGLKSGRLLGVALDVLENEKLDQLSEEQSEFFEYLQNSKNSIITPHIGGWSFESYERINEVLIRKINAFVGRNR